MQHVCGHACYLISVVSDFATLWTVARQDPLSVGFSRQEYWSGLPGPPPGDLCDLGLKRTPPVFHALQAETLPLRHGGSPTYNVVFIISAIHKCTN